MNDRYLLQYVSKQLKTIIRQYTLEGKITEKFTYCDQMKDEFGEMEIYNLFILTVLFALHVNACLNSHAFPKQYY